ncbi:MAG: hypothetical protein IJY35_00990 [Clostridia bacterium]|nr:hypothetical protein [Clostridia bacterium]
MDKNIIFVRDPADSHPGNAFGEYRTDGWVSAGKWTLTEGVPAGTWGVHPDYRTYYRWEDGSPLVHTTAVYTDFDYLLTVQMTEEGSAVIVFRMTDEKNSYFLRLDSVSDTASFGRCVNGEETVLSSCGIAIEPVTCTHVRIICRGSEISVRVQNDREASFFRSENPGISAAELTDETFSSGVCGVIAESAGVQFNNTSIVPLTGHHTIENELYTLVSGSYGEIRSLKVKNEPFDLNYVTNESEHRYEIGENQFLGEMIFRYSVNGEERNASTGHSEDIRRIEKVSSDAVRVTYSGNSANDNGIRDFTLTETYALEDDHIRLDLLLKNVTDQPIRFDDICLPVSWNNHWQFEEPYENYLAAADSFIAHEASYILLERAGGGGTKLVFTPDPETGTALEHRTLKSTQLTWMNPPEYYYIKSMAVNRDERSYLKPSCLTLAAGEEIRYSFLIHKTGGAFGDPGDLLYREGLLDLHVNPGMIFPTSMTAQLDIHTKHPVHAVTASDHDAVIELLSESDDRCRYALTFKKLGRIDVTVTYADNRRGVLQFWTEEPLDSAIQRRADFLMDHCRITDPDDCHCYSFFEWDNARNIPKEGGNRCSNNDFEQMYDGAGFIAEKQVYFPVQREISAMDDYLLKLVWEKEVIHGGQYDGYLCHKCCGGRCWSDPMPNVYPHLCTRAYNYPRIYNTFWSMYKTAKRYPGFEYRWDAVQYLRAAGMILRASLRLQPWIGLMGEQTVPDIIAALEAEGEISMAFGLTELSRNKCETMNLQKYPFASEYGTDSTGEEGAYTFSKMFGRRDTMKKTIDKSVAWTGKVPVWYWQTTSNRQDLEWWLFQYTVGLHGKIFHDYYMYETEESADAWSFVYPFKLVPFVHIHSGQPELIGPVGTAWGNYHASFPYNWDHGFPYSESAESDISLWAGLQLLSADVVEHDPVFGLTGWGCDVTENDGKLTVMPHDGLFRRLNLVERKISLEFLTHRWTCAVIDRELRTLMFDLTAVPGADPDTVSLKGLPAGEYEVRLNGISCGTVSSDGTSDALSITVPSPAGRLELVQL